MTQKINVAVLMGGRTAEHEVSLETGRVIVNALDKRKYNVKPVIITKTGRWLIPEGYMGEIAGSNKPLLVEDIQEYSKETSIMSISTGMALDKTVEEKVDVVFIAMHGPMGEDGTVQGLLELVDIPYTGSGVLASSVAMNKVIARNLFQHGGLNVPKGMVFNIRDWNKNPDQIMLGIKSDIGFPCVIKPVELGSSVGISIPKTEEKFKENLQNAFRYSNDILVEEFLEGPEVTCAVLGALDGEEPIPLVPTQIVPVTSEFFDYKAKYTPGATQEITPPRDVHGEMLEEVRQIAVKAHKILMCDGMSRTDMIIHNGIIYVLELNTIPGMTEVSLYPQAARAAGIEFSDLLDRIIKIAIENHKQKKRCVERD